MQNMTRLAAPLFAIFALSGCATTAQQTPLADGSNVAVGQRAMVDGPIVEPAKILEDSRCPMNARCIWAGRVRLQMVWIRGNGDRQAFEVTLGEPVQLADGQFTLESVRPERQTNVTLKPEDYRFGFRFAGGL